jgi:hypothetical protein
MSQYLFRYESSSGSYLIVSMFWAGGHLYYKFEERHGEYITRFPDSVDCVSAALEYLKGKLKPNYDFVGQINPT